MMYALKTVYASLYLPYLALGERVRNPKRSLEKMNDGRLTTAPRGYERDNRVAQNE